MMEAHVGEARDQPWRRERARALAGVLTGHPQFGRELVVEANRRLLRQLIHGRQVGVPGAADLVVEVLTWQLRPVRCRIPIQQRDTSRVQPVCRDLAQYAAILEARGLVGCAASARQAWILD